MKPSALPIRSYVWKDRKETPEETPMRFRTKFTVLVIAAILSLAGYGILAEALSVDRVMAAATPTTEVAVHITG
jgi:hypothetical protein